MRECKDIITAAKEQGWRFKPAAKSGHAYLVPPQGVPVGISSSPSDTHFRYQIIRLMRRSGFVWPWPPQDGGKSKPTNQEKATTMRSRLMNNHQVPVEEFRPVHNCSRYEISNTGRCIEKIDGSVIEPQPNGLLTLFDDNNKIYEQYTRTMVRQHFGYGPIKVNPLITDYVNQEDIVTTVEKEQVVTKTKTSKEEWKPLDDPRWQEGWTISSLGKLKRPDGSISPTFPGSNRTKNLIVGIRRMDGGATTTRLDKLVLTTFGSPPPPGAHPVYLDGDVANVSFENLDWSDAASAPATLTSVPDLPVEQVDVPVEPEVEPEEDGQTGAALVEEVVAEIAAAEDPEPVVEPEPEPEPEVQPEPFDPGPAPKPLSDDEEDIQGYVDRAVAGNTKVGVLGVTNRILGALAAHDIHIVADLLRVTEEDLANMNHVGRGSIETIKAGLEEMGLSLAEGPEVDWTARETQAKGAYRAAHKKTKKTTKTVARVKTPKAPKAPKRGIDAEEFSSYKGFTHLPTGIEVLVFEDGSIRLSQEEFTAEEAPVGTELMARAAQYRVIMGLK